MIHVCEVGSLVSPPVLMATEKVCEASYQHCDHFYLMFPCILAPLYCTRKGEGEVPGACKLPQGQVTGESYPEIQWGMDRGHFEEEQHHSVCDHW